MFDRMNCKENTYLYILIWKGFVLGKGKTKYEHKKNHTGSQEKLTQCQV